MSERHCTKCGTEAEHDDFFCRSCGARLAEQPTAAAPDPDTSEQPPVADDAPDAAATASAPTDDPVSPRRGLRYLVAGGIGLVVLLAVLLATGVIGGSNSEEEQQAALVARLREPFQDAMKSRDTLLLAEREFLSANTDSRAALRRYQRRAAEVRDANKRISDANEPLFDACANGSVACPNPTYEDMPNVPDVGSSIKELRSAATRLGKLNATVLSITPAEELKRFYPQLTSAIRSLQEDATYNADTLTKAVNPGEPAQGEGEGGYVDRAQTKTLRDESALPAIRELNAEALAVVRKLELPVSNYDVPGGTDRDPADHSTLR